MSRFFAVLGAVLVVAAVGGFLALKASPAETSPWGDRAEITSYGASSSGGKTSAAVSVEVNGVSAARIDQLVERLPPANLTNICAENAQLYRIIFTVGGGTRQRLQVIGYRCGELVVEVPSRGLTSDRVDRDCALLSAVRRLLPARAGEIQAGSCAGRGRLLAGVSWPGLRGGGREGSLTQADRLPRRPLPDRHKTRSTGTGSAPRASKSHDEKVPGQRSHHRAGGRGRNGRDTVRA